MQLSLHRISHGRYIPTNSRLQGALVTHLAHNQDAHNRLSIMLAPGWCSSVSPCQAYADYHPDTDRHAIP